MNFQTLRHLCEPSSLKHPSEISGIFRLRNKSEIGAIKKIESIPTPEGDVLRIEHMGSKAKCLWCPCAPFGWIDLFLLLTRLLIAAIKLWCKGKVQRARPLVRYTIQFGFICWLLPPRHTRNRIFLLRRRAFAVHFLVGRYGNLIQSSKLSFWIRKVHATSSEWRCRTQGHKQKTIDGGPPA